MADWLYDVSAALPLTYDIEALGEVGKTSLITAKLVRGTGIMAGVTLLALVLAAVTLRRRTGPLARFARLVLLLVPLLALLACGALVAGYLVETSHFVWTDNAQVEGDKIPITAPSAGIAVDWNAMLGATMHKGQIIGRIEEQQGHGPQRVIRAPADGTVAQDGVVNGSFVTAGTQLAVAYDLSQTFVTARVKETSIGGVRLGERVDISVDAYPGRTLTGTVWDIRYGTSGTFAPQTLPDNTTASFQKITQVIPVKITIPDREGLVLMPGMNVTAHIHKN